MQDSTALRETIADLLIELGRHLRRHMHALRPGDLTPEQFWLLKRVWSRGPLRIGELAAELGVTPSAVTVGCKRLERAGLVRRVRGATGDERVVLVTLTPDGEARVREWQSQRRRYLVELLAVLDPSELTALRPLLVRLVEAAGQEDGASDDSRRSLRSGSSLR
ncbi:MAG: MarR family transcriptional regulator [Thermomicrobium sp.]|nr:MarR family transcriptional regulator [Thermomicrobium sp.]